MKDLASSIGRSFIVSSLVPALFFAALNQLVIFPMLPSQLRQSLTSVEILPFVNGEGSFLILASIVVGFTLMSMNTPLIKAFEGYFLRGPLMVLKWLLLKRHRKQHEKVQEVQILLDEYTRANSSVKQQLKEILYTRYADTVMSYPRSAELTMPTRLGNIFKAFEEYPRIRYNLDSVVIWPRLLEFIPREYADQLEERNNSFTFMLNMSFLLFVLALEFLFCAIYFFALFRCDCVIHYIPTPPLCGDQYFQFGIWSVGGCLCALGLGYRFYAWSLPIAVTYGDLIRSCFDLFRHELLKRLGIPVPPTLSEEREIWSQLSDFLLFGEELGDPFSAKACQYPQEAQKSVKQCLLVISGLTAAVFAFIKFRSRARRVRTTVVTAP